MTLLDPQSEILFKQRHLFKKGTNFLVGAHYTPDVIDLFKELVFYDGNVPESLLFPIQKIMEQSHELVFALSPLYEVCRKGEIDFDIVIAGGAIRDLLLGQPEKIKDLDVILSVQFKYSSPEEQKKLFNPLLHLFTTDDHNELNIKNLSPYSLFYHLVRKLLTQQMNVEKSIHINDVVKKKDSYGRMITNNILEGVLKVNDQRHHYPMDLLFSHMTPGNYVKRVFDFNICRTYVKVFDSTKYYQHFNMPTNTFEFLDKLYLDYYFLKDVMDKTLTLYMPVYNNLGGVENSLKTHYPRIKEKYPEYSLTIVPGSKEDYVQWLQEYKYKMLDDQLNTKETITKRLKI